MVRGAGACGAAHGFRNARQGRQNPTQNASTPQGGAQLAGKYRVCHPIGAGLAGQAGRAGAPLPVEGTGFCGSSGCCPSTASQCMWKPGSMGHTGSAALATCNKTRPGVSSSSVRERQRGIKDVGCQRVAGSGAENEATRSVTKRKLLLFTTSMLCRVRERCSGTSAVNCRQPDCRSRCL